MFQRTIIALLVALLVLWLPAPAAAQQVEVYPPAGTPGTRFVFVARGFQPEERLSAWVNAPDGRVLEERAGVPEEARSDGVASWNWAPPLEYQPGFWQIVVHGRESGFEQVLTFQIVAIGQPVPGAVPPPPAADKNIHPNVGNPGTIFRFYATGFTPGERVDTHALTPNNKKYGDDFIVNLHAEESGRLDGSWTAPISAPSYGVWQIVMTGRASKVEQRIPFTIEQLTAPTATPLQVSPTVGKPGMRFLFYTSGFKPNEELSVWLNTPDAQIIELYQKQDLRAQPDGRASWEWVAPFDVQLGFWSMVARGKESGIEQVVPFQIIPGI